MALGIIPVVADRTHHRSVGNAVRCLGLLGIVVIQAASGTVGCIGAVIGIRRNAVSDCVAHGHRHVRGTAGIGKGVFLKSHFRGNGGEIPQHEHQMSGISVVVGNGDRSGEIDDISHLQILLMIGQVVEIENVHAL